MREIPKKKLDECIYVDLSGVVFLDAFRLMEAIDLRMIPELAEELASRLQVAASKARETRATTSNP